MIRYPLKYDGCRRFRFYWRATSRALSSAIRVHRLVIEPLVKRSTAISIKFLVSRGRVQPRSTQPGCLESLRGTGRWIRDARYASKDLWRVLFFRFATLAVENIGIERYAGKIFPAQERNYEIQAFSFVKFLHFDMNLIFEFRWISRKEITCCTIERIYSRCNT